MAESASAAAPSGGPGAKSSSSSGTWWKSLATRKKSKEGAPVVGAAPAPAWPPAGEPSEMLPAPSRASDPTENQALGSGGGGGGGGSRRNLKISRSGRFKEKRKVRTALLPESPQKLFEGCGGGGGAGGPAGGSAAAGAPSDERPCQ